MPTLFTPIHSSPSGIQGWFPVSLPEGTSLPVSSSFSKLSTVGALVELSIFFPHADSDREKIVLAASLWNFDAKRLVAAPEEFWHQGNGGLNPFQQVRIHEHTLLAV